MAVMHSEKRIKKRHDTIIYNIGSLYVLLSQYFSGVYRDYRLTPAKFNILMLVKNMGKEHGVPQIDLGDKLYVSAANITKIIDALEKIHLVSRIPSLKDRRVKLIKITDRGLKLLDKVWEEHVRALNNFCNDFTLKEKEQFNTYLERLLKDVKENI